MNEEKLQNNTVLNNLVSIFLIMFLKSRNMILLPI